VVLDAPGATILVVEDDAIQADALDALFTGYGYDVIIAHDADEALVAVPARLDLIVSDYRLPKHKTGVDVVVSLRQATGRSIPAIVMTGDAQANIALEVARAGCEIIHKPCMPNLLVKAVFRVLSSSCG
jgi:CheY-like chemotaxis protein